MNIEISARSGEVSKSLIGERCICRGEISQEVEQHSRCLYNADHHSFAVRSSTGEGNCPVSYDLEPRKIMAASTSSSVLLILDTVLTEDSQLPNVAGRG